MAAKRHRDAGTGKIVSAKEAAARPKETISEDRSDAARLKRLEERVDLLETAIVKGEAVAKQLYGKQQENL
jgi:hypothetical protein